MIFLRRNYFIRWCFGVIWSRLLIMAWIEVNIFLCHQQEVTLGHFHSQATSQQERLFDVATSTRPYHKRRRKNDVSGRQINHAGLFSCAIRNRRLAICPLCEWRASYLLIKCQKELVQNLNSSRAVFSAVTFNDELCKRRITLLLIIIQT